MTRPMTCAMPAVFPATEAMFSRILTTALLAGAGAGLVAALLQLVFVQPVLLQAELYEAGELVHFGAQAVAANPALPGVDPLRDGLSALFTLLIRVGFALVLVALMSLAEGQGHAVNGRTGILWGIAGFVAVQLAPGMSLPPEVPGVAAADVTARQIWWSGTVASAALAMWLIAFGRGRVMWGLAAMLLLAPHVVGAPAPDSFAGLAPPELAALFAARVLAVGMVVWVLTGCLAGHIWGRFGAGPA